MKLMMMVMVSLLQVISKNSLSCRLVSTVDYRAA